MKVTDSICDTAPSGISPGHDGLGNDSAPDLDAVLLEMIAAESAHIPGARTWSSTRN